mmetsp:Transcript_2242/g.5061  ORF Transcript_2242/g.5061 Transcript_2242/m.5061 type:complete len:234 (+) Transcript_2242:440-1141(+)
MTMQISNTELFSSPSSIVIIATTGSVGERVGLRVSITAGAPFGGASTACTSTPAAWFSALSAGARACRSFTNLSGSRLMESSAMAPRSMLAGGGGPLEPGRLIGRYSPVMTMLKSIALDAVGRRRSSPDRRLLHPTTPTPVTSTCTFVTSFAAASAAAVSCTVAATPDFSSSDSSVGLPFSSYVHSSRPRDSTNPERTSSTYAADGAEDGTSLSMLVGTADGGKLNVGDSDGL